jgi:small-conductance mechanosensitive channel
MSVVLMYALNRILQGDVGALFVWWAVSQPAHLLARTFEQNWPNYHRATDFTSMLIVSSVNALVGALLFGLITTVIHWWVFVAPRKNQEFKMNAEHERPH